MDPRARSLVATILVLACAPLADAEDHARLVRAEIEGIRDDPVLGRRSFVVETSVAPWVVFLELPDDSRR